MGGLENRWAPEQLLLCALAGCFTTTFHEVACGARFGYTDLEVEVEGSVRRNHNAGRDFSEILLRPRLTVPSEDQREVGLELLRQAKEACMISRAITVPQTLEPSVVTLKVPVGGWNNQDATVKLEA
jgi:organic hydroperoxide reductase OsmC/OhrA